MEMPSPHSLRPAPLDVGARLILLVEAGRQLLGAQRPEEVALRLTSLLYTHLRVDTCTVELVEEPGTPPSALEVLTAALRRLPGVSEAEARVARALRGGEPELLAASAEGDTRAVLLPLRRRGRTHGLVLLAGEGLDPGLLALVREVLALAAQGLEQTSRDDAALRALARTEAASTRMEGLQTLTLALSTALTTQEVARIAVEQAVRTLGALSGGLFLLEPGGGALELVHAVGYGEDARRSFARIPLGASTPASDAVRTGQAVWLHHMAEYSARYPVAAAATRTHPERDLAIACLPLTSQAPLGCLAIGFRGRRAFEADECAWLGVLAQQCAMALERARLLAAERRQAARAEYLRRFTAALAGSRDVEETLWTAAGLVLPELADFCFFDVRTPEGDVRRVARAHESPERQRLLEGTRWVASERPEQSICALESGAPVFHPRIDDAWMRQVARGEAHLELLRALGPCSRISVPLRVKERVLGGLTLYFAQSGRHYTEEELGLAMELGRGAAVALENAQLFQQAREAVRLRDDFLAIASHELNTPLTALKLQLARMGRTTGEEETRGRVTVAGQQVDRLSKLVRELLDVSRISEGRLRLECEELDLVALCREALGRFGDELVRTGTAVHVRAEGPVVGRWDGSRMDQVVTNLVSNALKYGRGRPVELEVGAADGVARLVVRDRGIGIAPEQQARLFQRFERGVSLRHYGGFGLGLWIARQVVEAHGGRIRLESALDEGTCVTVELPLSPP